MAKDFEEIAHCGGKITFRLRTNEEGQRSYQVTYSGDRPVPMSLLAVYALPQGVPVASIDLGGIELHGISFGNTGQLER